MHKDRYVFAQLASFLDRNKFNFIVRKYDGDKYVKHFTCWNQLLSMMFGQLSNRESLRDLIVALDAHHSKSYHLGLGKNVSKSSLARANKNRDYHIFEEYAYYLVNEARQKRVPDIFKLDGNVYAFDSTTIDLCLSVFWWAKFQRITTKTRFFPPESFWGWSCLYFFSADKCERNSVSLMAHGHLLDCMQFLLS